MMSVRRLARIFRGLESEDFRVLLGLELSMSRYEYAPSDVVARLSKLSTTYVELRLNRLLKFKLVRRWTGPYTGYTLTYAGYDCLSLNALIKTGVIEAIGKPLGIGKEADVYDALDPSGKMLAIKFHRLGRTSFRQTRRVRDYTERPTFWLLRSKAAAEKEYRGLSLVYPHGVATPKPIAQNRHVVVTDLIVGAPIAEYMEIPRPERVLNEILENVRKAYMNAGVIHADLSEFNILIKPDAHVLIIDWPQFITCDHPNADELLERDVKNVLSFFRRKFGIRKELAEVLEFVKGHD